MSGYHNWFFKRILSDPLHFANLLKFFFKNISRKIDITTLKRESESIINEKVKEFVADLIFSAKLKNHEAKFIVFLLEHKSYPDEFIYLQLLVYIVYILQNYKKEAKQLPIVIPIIIYNGTEDWEPKRLRDKISSFDETLKRFIPDFDVLFIDVKDLSFEMLGELEKDEFLFLLFSVSRLATKRTKEEFWEEYKKIFAELVEISKETDIEKRAQLLETMLNYLGHLPIVDETLKQKIMETVVQDPGLGVILEDLINKGKQLGLQEGKRLGLQEGKRLGLQEGKRLGLQEGKEKTLRQVVKRLYERGLGVEDIAEWLNLSVEEVENYLREPQKKVE